LGDCTQREGKYFVSTSESDSEITVDLNLEKIQLDLRYHRKKIKFEIKKNNGRYVVFDTDRNGKIICNQTVRRPFFD